MRFLTVAASLAVLVPGAAHAAPPSNDNVSRARPIETMPFEVTINTKKATIERREIQPACGSSHSTVWFVISFADELPVGISTYGSSYDTMVGVYTGTNPKALKRFACNNDGGTRDQSLLTWRTTRGATYAIQVGSSGGPGGGTLRFRMWVGLAHERDGAESFNISAPWRADAVVHPTSVDAGFRSRADYCLPGNCFEMLNVRADAARQPSGAGDQNACVFAGGSQVSCS